MTRPQWAFIGVAGLVLVSGTVFVVAKFGPVVADVPLAARELPDAVRAYRRAGLPWVAADLRTEVPPAENAAPALRAAFKKWDTKAFRTVERDLKKEPTAAVLAPFEPALDDVRLATARTRVDFGRDWDYGPYIEFREYRPMKESAKALVARARVRLMGGRTADGIADLRAAHSLGDLAGQEPTIISALVRIAIAAIVRDGVRRAAAESPAAIPALRILAAEPRPRPDWNRATRGEAYIGIATTRNMHLYRPTGEDVNNLPSPESLVRAGTPDGRMKRAFLTRHLQWWTKALADGTMRKDPRAVARRMDVMENAMPRKPSYTLLAILLPVISKAVEVGERFDDDAKVTRAYLALLAGPRPFPARGPNGFRYRREGRGFRLWTVGPNGIDENGRLKTELPLAERADSKIDDVVALYPPPKAIAPTRPTAAP